MKYYLAFNHVIDVFFFVIRLFLFACLSCLLCFLSEMYLFFIFFPLLKNCKRVGK